MKENSIGKTFEEWCNSDHGGAMTSFDGNTCELSWFLHDETVTLSNEYLQGNLVMENGDPMEFQVDRDKIQDLDAIGADLHIETTDGEIRIKRDRRF